MSVGQNDKKEESEEKKEEEQEDQITRVIDELKGFQGILDSKNIKLSKKSFRAWAGHINFCLITIIEEFQKLRQIILDFLPTEEEKNKKNKDYNKHLYS